MGPQAWLHSWGDCAAPGCISLCWGTLGTTDSKAEGPNRARYPPKEGHRDSWMQGGANLVTSVPGRLRVLLLSELLAQLSA